MKLGKRARRWVKPLIGRFVFKRQVAKSDFVVVSIKKSGRTWLRAMLTRLFHNCYGTPTNLLLDADNHKKLNHAAPSVLFAHDSDPVASELAVATDLSTYDDAKVILLVRHPADTVVSLYHHYKNRKTGKRQELAAKSTIFDFATRPGHGIRTIISFLNRWAEYARLRSNVMVVRYEDLRFDPAIYLEKVAAHLGVTASRQDINDAVEFASLENLRRLELEGFFNDRSLRKGNSQNPDALKVRRGQVAGYKDYFSRSECAQIEDIIRRELHLSFGYGENPSRTSPFDIWTDRRDDSIED
jgi:hypothetical protein